MPPKRFLHVLGVVQTATCLAAAQGLAPEKVLMAALLHDCAKSYSKEALEQRRLNGEFTLEEEDLQYPSIWHGPAGASIARSKYGVEDEEVLEAIRHHTLGAPSPSWTLRVLMAADATEPTRIYPELEQLRKALRCDFHSGLIKVLRHKVADLEARGRQPHSRIFQTLKYLEQE